jgi:hypothetical protein
MRGANPVRKSDNVVGVSLLGRHPDGQQPPGTIERFISALVRQARNDEHGRRSFAWDSGGGSALRRRSSVAS